jgi:inorganic pyrophosphatase
MPEKRYIKKLLQISEKFDIDRYEDPDFIKSHVSFEGMPRKHATDARKIVLLTDPFSDENRFYEFPIGSISFIEEIGTITSEDGRSAQKLRLWIKRGTLGLRYTPFIV